MKTKSILIKDTTKEDRIRIVRHADCLHDRLL